MPTTHPVQREGYVVVEDLFPERTVERLTTRIREYVAGETFPGCV